jgi:hypothetical protein
MAPVCRSEGCDEPVTVEHHIIGADGVEVTEAQCAVHHNERMAELLAVPMDDPARYRMEWTRPHPDV